jgi:hypothetical protein
MDALVVSSIRIDADLIAPEVGPYTKSFIPSTSTTILLSQKSITKSNEILSDMEYTLKPEQEMLAFLKQVESAVE